MRMFVFFFAKLSLGQNTIAVQEFGCSRRRQQQIFSIFLLWKTPLNEDILLLANDSVLSVTFMEIQIQMFKISIASDINFFLHFFSSKISEHTPFTLNRRTKSFLSLPFGTFQLQSAKKNHFFDGGLRLELEPRN